MNDNIWNEYSVFNLIVHQLNAYWYSIDKNAIWDAIPNALNLIKENFWNSSSKRFFDGGNIVFSPYYSIHWMIFLYCLSKCLFQKGNLITADQVYYLNKIMHSVDWFYEIDLPIHFFPEHPLGSVLGKANYGDYLLIYQGTTVGGSIREGELCYPTLGDNVILFSNSSILGDCKIGSNVIVSAGARIVNEHIPDNCIVFGASPDVVKKEKTASEMKIIIDAYWR